MLFELWFIENYTKLKTGKVDPLFSSDKKVSVNTGK